MGPHAFHHVAERVRLAGAAAVLCVMAARGAGPNLAANGGFEQWPEPPTDAPGWGATSYDVRVAGRENVPQSGRAYRTGEGEADTERHSGKYAQYIQTTTWGRGVVSRGIQVEAGQSYRVALWIKLLSGTFRLGVCFSHSPWTYLDGWTGVEATGRWVQVVKEVAIPEGCQGIAVIMFPQTGSAYLDDLEVVHCGVAPPPDDPASDRLPLLPGRLAPRITRTRLALFDEPAFPSESPRSTEWYETVARDAGLSVARVSHADILDPTRFGADRFDTLILPTGGNFPSDAETPVERFLARGGTVVIDENLAYRTAPAPAALSARIADLKAAYEQGKGGYEYFDFMAKHMWIHYGNVFHLDSESGEWRPTLRRCQNYEYVSQATFPLGLHLDTWPNYAAPFYARPYDADVVRNPILAHLLGGLPPTIPADRAPSGARGATRLRLAEGKGLNRAGAEEYACDLLLPLYLFPEVSARKYPAFPEAGKHERDRDTDFYILRYHDYLKEGGTLVHFGVAGAKLLRGEAGASVLLAALRLAESELPGECPPEFVRTANRARETFSEYSGTSIRFRTLAVQLAQCAHYAGHGEAVAGWRARFDGEVRRFGQLGNRARALEDLLPKREGGFAYGHRTRAALVRDLVEAAGELKTALADMHRDFAARTRVPTDVASAQPPFGYIYFGLDNADRRGQGSLDAFRALVEKLGLRFEGYQISSYRHEYTFNGHPFKSEFESGVLDPAAGVVKPKTYRWMETAEDWEHWRESFRWQFERARNDPRINSVFGLDESDLEWSLWGPRTHALFLGYLRDRYRTVDAMNAVWGSTHAAIDEVALPLTKPETQTAHALWEDWTRFREVYRRDRELMPIAETVGKLGEGLRYFTWCTYNQHDRHPANGINFYEYGKAMAPFGVNGFEHSNEEHKEWLAFDICSMFSRHCTAEWGAFYFPPAGHQAKIDLLAERLWKGLANGQVGWCLFSCSAPGAGNSNFFDMANLPLPLGHGLAELNAAFKTIDHIVLDGRREEPQVRIVYSPTTRRHTSWPGVEGDLSFRSTSGLYSYFKNTHLPARAIDEQAVWEGHLAPECRLLVLSHVLYESRALHDAVRSYLHGGGSVLVTPATGRFDEYGRRRDAWLGLAGVVPKPVAEKVIPVREDLRYFSAGYADDVVGLEPLFPDEARILARFTDGTAAVTETRVGSGRLFVVGANLGLDCYHQWKGRPEIVDALLEPVFGAAGVRRDLVVTGPSLMARLWQHRGDRYLFLTSPTREGLCEYALAVRGNWDVRDHMLGVPLQVRFDGAYSRTSGLVASPGGTVLALTPAARETETLPELTGPRPQPSGQEAGAPAREPRPLPFAGRLWSREGRVDIGGYRMELDVETGGGWGGELYLTAARGKESLRRRCETGSDSVFHFSDRVLRVACEEAHTVYPVNLQCRMTEGPLLPSDTGCSVVSEPFHGMDSLVLDNGLLRLRLLPALGGRVIELNTLPDGTNHLRFDAEAAREGIGKTSVQIGGLKENPGGYPGPYWDADFRPTVVEDTPDRVVVRLAMREPAEWAYGYARPKSGINRLEKEFVLERGRSTVTVNLTAFNEAGTAMPTGLRTHPEWAIGGDGDPADVWVVRQGGRVTTLRHPFSGTYPAEGDWTAVVDTSKRLAFVNAYSPAATESLYTCGKTHYNLELWARAQTVAPGQALSFSHALHFVHGLSGVTEFSNDVALHIDLREHGVLGEGEPLTFDVEVGSVREFAGRLTATIMRDGEVLHRFTPEDVQATAGRAVTTPYRWVTSGRAGGDYEVAVDCVSPNGTTQLRGRCGFRVAGAGTVQRREGLSRHDRALGELLRRYAERKQAGAPDGELADVRSRAVRARILLDELRELAARGEWAAGRPTEAALEELLAPGTP